MKVKTLIMVLRILLALHPELEGKKIIFCVLLRDKRDRWGKKKKENHVHLS